MGARTPARRRPATAARTGAVLSVTVAIAATAAGCGAPAYEYVKNSEHKVYFRVPASWQEIDPAMLDKVFFTNPADSARGRLERAATWLKAYDADKNPDIRHLYGAEATHEPVVLAKVVEVPEQARGTLSLDGLRDAFLPVTPAARANQPSTTNFELLRDEVLTPGDGLRGVREVYNYRPPSWPATQTFDQTAFLNDDASKLYLFVVSCSATCYAERRGEIQDVVSSMTVRG